MELVVALITLAVGILGFLSMVNLSSRQTWLGGRDTRVSALMTDQLERLRAGGYGELTAGTRTEGDFTLTWEPDPADSTYVILVASYPTWEGTQRSDTLVAHIERP